MKKHGIYNKELIAAIANMGHEDYIIISDAGLPSRDDQKIDLSIAAELPTIAQILDLVMDEFVFEEIIVAQETKDYNPEHFAKIEELTHKRYADMDITVIPHADLLAQYKDKAKYIVRTGDRMPWGNVILRSGIDAKVWFQKPGCIIPDFYAQRANRDN